MSTSTKLSLRQLALLAVPVVLVLVPMVLLVFWVNERHQWAQEQLDTLEPRYARLLGLQAQEEEIQQMLERIGSVKARHVYPGENDATQTGNIVQQSLRSALDRAGLTVVSSQVRPNPEEGPFERIDVVTTVEGDWPAMQMGLLSLKDISPTVWLDNVEINLMGSLQTNDTKAAPKFSAQLTFSILRSKTS